MLEHLKEQLNITSNQKSVFHSFIAGKLKEKANSSKSNIIKRREALTILYRYNISKKFIQSFLNEMEAYGLIKLKDKQNIEVLKPRVEKDWFD